MDYEDIESLFNNGNEVKKFSHKRWVKIHPGNTNYSENTSNMIFELLTIN